MSNKQSMWASILLLLVICYQVLQLISIDAGFDKANASLDELILKVEGM